MTLLPCIRVTTLLMILFALSVAAQQTTPDPAPAPLKSASDSLPTPAQPPAPEATRIQASAVPAPDAAPTEATSAPTAPAPSKTDQDNRDILRQEQSKHGLGVVPMFNVTNRQNAPPLTRGQKFHLFTADMRDPFTFTLAGLQAGYGQATNEFPEYGQGVSGYSKRYGASLADTVSSSFFSVYFYPVLLKEDPRYFRLGEGATKHRIGYAIAQEFICHTDKGKRSFNWSAMLGAFSSGALSNVYYPKSARGFSLTMSRSAIAVIYATAGGLADEFWPDIQKKVFHKNREREAPRDLASTN
jgi:hypothetical protein